MNTSNAKSPVAHGALVKGCIMRCRSQSPCGKIFTIYVACSPLARPLGRLVPPPSPSWVFLSNQDKPMQLEQTPWNITEVFCTAGNQKKRKPLYQQIGKKETRLDFPILANLCDHKTTILIHKSISIQPGIEPANIHLFVNMLIPICSSTHASWTIVFLQ